MLDITNRHQPLQLQCQLGPNRNQVRRLTGEVGKSVQRVAPHQLVYRLFMVINGDRYVTVIQRWVTAVTSQYQQRGRLLAAYIAAGLFARGERRHQSFSERCARAFECPDHVIDDIVTCPTQPLAAGLGACCPARGAVGDLPRRLAVVGGQP